MDTVGKDSKAGQRPGGHAGPVRPGQSGEGARSAFEQLLQQERKREAQLPREDAVPGTPAGPRRA